MLRTGNNTVEGITVTVTRRRAKRIILRVKPDGSVALTIPDRHATLRDAEAFIRSKWDWVVRTRTKTLATPPTPEREYTAMELARLQTLLGELHALWAARLGFHGVARKIRKMKTRWGVCNWVKRCITYSAMLAFKPRELVEYVVVHEFTHFDVHGHGPGFKTLMDARLPDWRILRKRLNNR